MIRVVVVLDLFGLPVTSGAVGVRGQVVEVFGRPHHPLESPAFAGGAVPGGDTARQDAHHCAAVKVLGAKPNFFSLLRLKRGCCAFFTIPSVWVDYVCLSVMCTLRNFNFPPSPLGSRLWIRGVLPLLFPEVHDQLLCFVDIE
jgi:hypothetical protein